MKKVRITLNELFWLKKFVKENKRRLGKKKACFIGFAKLVGKDLYSCKIIVEKV